MRLIHGDLTRRRADCFVVNHYSGLQTTGAAKAVDQYMNGVLSKLAARQVLNTPPGTIYFVPSHYATMSADVVAVLSMGEYERFVVQENLDQSTHLSEAPQFAQEQLRLFGHRLAVSCCEVNLRNVASPVHGTGRSTKIAPAMAAQYFLAGYYQGLTEQAQPGETYFLTLVDLDASKLSGFQEGIEAAIEAGLVGALRSVGTIQTDAVGVDKPWLWVADLDDQPESPTLEVPAHLRLGALRYAGDRLKLTTIGTGSADQVVFDAYPDRTVADLRIQMEKTHNELLRDLFHLERLLPSRGSDGDGSSQDENQKTSQNETQDGPQEACLEPQNHREQDSDHEETMFSKRADIRHKLAKLNQESEEQFLEHGRYLLDQIFDPALTHDIRQRLAGQRAKTLLLRLDESTANIPWELFADQEGLYALNRSIGRQLELVGQVRQPPPKEADADYRLRVLIVANPTGDLPAVEMEARRILDALYGMKNVEIQLTALFGEEAEQRYVISLLSERFDVFHYAGHAIFRPERPSESGLLLTGGDVFTADMMWSLPTPPGLVFFNACESAAIAEAKPSEGLLPDGDYVSELPLGSVSALLRAGTSNFVGTTWPVEDSVAAEMAIVCYAELAAGHSVGESLRRARLATIEELGYGHLSWSSYVLYGSPWNRLLST